MRIGTVWKLLYRIRDSSPEMYKLFQHLLRLSPIAHLRQFIQNSYRSSNAKWNINTAISSINSQYYFRLNQERVLRVIDLLADDKSIVEWGGAILYRVLRIPYRHNEYSLNDQYFVKGVVSVSDNEVFVDCGAYLGDTTINFIDYAKRSNRVYKKIVAFEPSKSNYEQLLKNISKERDVITFNKGVSDHEGIVGFTAAKKSNSGRIIGDKTNAATFVSVVSIDDVQECSDATFIKMDIEGSELSALKGAKKTIIRNQPKLAICIYHSDADMIEIIEYIHEINPNYKLYVRQHSDNVIETVLYAIP